MMNAKKLIAAASLALTPVVASEPASAHTGRPDVLFIIIDDQNDWIGALGGHPMARTPNLDALARRGTVFFNAHCQSPLCNPSRTSVLLGLRPSTTGVYGLAPWFRSVEALRNRVTLPQHFHASGYRTMATGKVYHFRPDSVAEPGREFDVWDAHGGIGARPPRKLIPPTPMGNHPLMDWGVFPHRDEDKGDYQVASWAIEQIRSSSREKALFLATGFFLPHVPCYATQPWFDLYPDDDSILPPVLARDRDDTPRFSWYLHWRLPEPRLGWLKENGQWRNLVRSYLACVSFTDAQVGRLLEALEASGRAGNTIIVVWGDNGFHLGEKDISGKNTLWERSTRVPLILAGPGIPQGRRLSDPVELLDLYPTLIDLCGLPRRGDLEGGSLVPLMQGRAVRTRPAITTHNQGNHSVRSRNWRYICYADGTEELYDLAADPNEWENLAGEPRCRDVLAEHRRWLPRLDLPPAPGSADRILTYDPATDEGLWEGETVRRGDSIPQR